MNRSTKQIFRSVSVAVLAAPLESFAEGYQVRASSRFSDFGSFVGYVTSEILNPITSILFAAVVVYFLWGMVQYVKNAEDSDARHEGRDRMVWGMIAIAVVAALWTLVRIVVNSLS